VALSAISYVRSDDSKMPITTKSEEALQLFLKGRDLSERLRNQEAVEYFERAVEADPDFAMAHMFLAFSQPSAKQFFASFNRCRALADRLSEGEQLVIRGFEAGAIYGDPVQQRRYYQRLVEAFPRDERVLSLLAGNYFNQQEWDDAVELYMRAADVNPDYSPAYNQMGYAYRSLGDFEKAETAFKRYIELIPDDPNPYDSYAELLLKMGRYEESIAYYERALTVNPQFSFSRLGISANRIMQEDYDAALEQLQTMYDSAADNGRRRQALYGKAVCYVDMGDFAAAHEQLRKAYVVDSADNDWPQMAADLGTMTRLYVEQGNLDEAASKTEQAVNVITDSDLSSGVKGQARINYILNLARIAIAQKDWGKSEELIAQYREKVDVARNPVQIRNAHELAGKLALGREQWDEAIREFDEANQQDPEILYLAAQAWEGKGEQARAEQSYQAALNFRSVGSLSYALVRLKSRLRSAVRPS